MDNQRYIAVIGASNIDIGGTPYAPLIKADSNPGRISISFGGVGNNIARNLRRLGMNVIFITAAGSDYLGREMISRCSEEGMDMSYSIISDDHSSSMYLYINDDKGDMELALSDMDMCSLITPEYIDNISYIINGAEAVAADCNLTEETIERIIQVSKVPVFIDPVSVSKSYKIKDHLKGIYALKPNVHEASYLADIEINNRDDCIRAAQILIDKGINKIFISMGESGILAADENNIIFSETVPAQIINTTGAGDSSTAAIIWAHTDDFIDLYGEQLISNSHDHLKAAADAANAAAAVNMSSDSSVSDEMSPERIISMIRQ